MAEKETQGNIRQEFNSATYGLNLDQTSNQIKKGTLSYALNANVENFDANSINYQNEQGNTFCFKFPDGYILIGQHFIPEQSKHIFFLTNPTTRDCEIGFSVNNDCKYIKLFNDPCLGWDVTKPIHKMAHRITNCSTEIYWPDNIARRYLDIDNLPYKLKSGSVLCDPVYSTEIDCNQLKVQPDFNIPILNIQNVISGGNLISGTYQFAAQYGDSLGNPYTSYYSVTNPTPIADLQLATVNFNTPVGKSIVVNLDNLDVTGQFQYINLAVIKTINNISSYELVGTYFIDNNNLQITYTGQSNTDIKLSVNDIFEKFPYYEIADDITTAQDILIWKGLTSIDRVNYQHIASKIKLQWETYRIPANENYSDELNATNLRGYLRDEIYPFEIVFELKNGKQTDAFHIPGREKTPNEINKSLILSSNPDYVGEGNPEPNWKIYNTATVTEFSPEYKPDENYKGPYQYGEFAYWESIEEYPCDKELWGELSGQPIRHHKFPDNLVSSHIESKQYGGSLEMGDVAKFPIGVRIDTNQIKSIIDSSSLSQIQKEDIVGYKIIRGSRDTNKSIVGKGILRNVNTYTREDQDYYYPNYPYNDLGEDPFLNKINNAWTDISDPFIITVYDLPDIHPVTSENCLIVKYIDVNTNKENIKYYTSLGEQDVLCAIGKPVITAVGKINEIYYNRGSGGDATVQGGSDNIATISYAEFDVVKVFIQSGIQRKFLFEWDDPISGVIPYANYYTGAGQSWTLRIRVGQIPYCVAGECSNLRYEILSQYERRLDSCAKETSQTFSNVDKNLQIFNSPETSFGQPFLGNILKLENTLYGGGKAHFVEVDKNAKYKLLSEEAQRDALKSSEDIAKITTPFSIQALFSAYQAYLTIYINGITRKNYAYSYNSIADYNYVNDIPNSGNKQRQIELSKYLIPAVQSVGEENSLNNYQRESSVFIKTTEEKEGFDFPSTASGVVDRSRMTVESAGSCSTPGAEKPIEVVSYYGSMKNIFLGQWGQIYSYPTVDTGFYSKLENGGTKTIFGGDTFISRFAFKTKLPFFIDNRVGAPDDSDIFYDEIGNIAYPKYWHSARSILSNVTLENGDNLGILKNFISYKAHNFDCYNNPSTIEIGSNRTYYDGIYYLFAYGVPYFYCESSYNTDLRQAFNNREGDFFPNVSTGIPDDWLQENFVSIQNDNTYNYNVTFSKQNKENTFSHIPLDWNKKCFTNYPFRAIYSDLQIVDSDNRLNSWLIYRAVSYHDFPQNFGNLTAIDGIQNKAILARFENKTLMYNNLLTIDTSNPQAAYVGNPRLFDNPPVDYAETDIGYVGSQHKFLLKIPQGQISVDAKRGQVFLLSGQQVTDLSAFGSGMNRFLKDHLPFNILKQFNNINIDNHYNDVGLHGIYDAKFNRVIISKLDYLAIDKNIKYDGKDFYTEENISEDVSIKTIVYLNDEELFCNKSWTLSFNFNTKSWISFHSYIPNFYLAENNFFYSGVNNCCGDENNMEGLVGVLVDTITTTTTTLFIPPTTTTTTTAVPLDCEISGGTFVETDCVLEGTAVITIPATTTTTICQRPSNLPNYPLFTGYIVNGILTDTTIDTNTVCQGITQYDNSFDENPVVTTMVSFVVEANSISIGEVVYLGQTNDCTLVPNGWYFTDETTSPITPFYINAGVITEIVDCNNISTFDDTFDNTFK